MRDSHPPPIARHPVEITAAGARINADLALPDDARGIVVFAHGSGSGRFSPRNRAVASSLNDAGIATLLVDLLTPGEEAEDTGTGRHRFDIALLASRVEGVTQWLTRDERTRDLPIGYFGASTGAAAALVAAARRPESVRAIVSRGGRPDLAGAALHRVVAPTLLIVGGNDPVVVQLNQLAKRELRAPSSLVVVPGATHLFPEPGAMEAVTDAAIAWFAHHFAGSPTKGSPTKGSPTKGSPTKGSPNQVG